MNSEENLSSLPPPVAELARQDTARFGRMMSLGVGIPALVCLVVAGLVLHYVVANGVRLSTEHMFGHGAPVLGPERALGGKEISLPERGLRGEEFFPMVVGAFLGVAGLGAVAWAWLRRHPLLALSAPGVTVTEIFVMKTLRIGGGASQALHFVLADGRDLSVILPSRTFWGLSEDDDRAADELVGPILHHYHCAGRNPLPAPRAAGASSGRRG